MEGFHMNIGERIKQRREALGYTQEELAKKLGYAHRSSVQKIENAREISMKKIEQYAQALETTVPYLMGWDDNLTEDNADVLTDVLSNQFLLEHIKKLMSLNKEHQQTIYDNIAYWYEREGH